MNPWISRIALAAYLVGGWLLPAMHHHGHNDHLACGHHATGEHHAKGGVCSHEHESVSVSRCCSHETEEAEADACEQSSPQEYGLVAGQQITVCSGLCALCSARTLRSHTLLWRSSGVQTGVSEFTVASDGHRLPPPEFLSSISSRGPPAVL